MIAAFITIIGLILGFWEKIHLFERPITGKKWLVISLLVSAAILSGVKDFMDDRQQAHDSDTIDSLNAHVSNLTGKSEVLDSQLSYFRRENKVAQQRHEDTLVKYGKEHSKEIQTTAYTMTKIFSEGQKRNEENTNKLSGKLDSNKLKPAQIEFLRQPHNVFTISSNNGNIDCEISIENSGDLVAFGLSFIVYIIIEQGGISQKTITEFLTPDDLSTSTRLATITLPRLAYLYDSIQRFYCVVDATYFSDREHKNKRFFKKCLYRDAGSTQSHKYLGDIDELLTHAIWIRQH